MTDAAAKTSVARALAGVAAFIALLASLAVAPLVYLQSAGLRARATIIDTQERVELLDGGAWQHVFEITYRYRPDGATTDMTVADFVDRHTFARRRIDPLIRSAPIPSIHPADKLESPGVAGV